MATQSWVADFALHSSAFDQGGPIPRRHCCEGEDLSPPLSWSGAPEGTRSLALVVDDPDAPAGTFTHWLGHQGRYFWRVRTLDVLGPRHPSAVVDEVARQEVVQRRREAPVGHVRYLDPRLLRRLRLGRPRRQPDAHLPHPGR